MSELTLKEVQDLGDRIFKVIQDEPVKKAILALAGVCGGLIKQIECPGCRIEQLTASVSTLMDNAALTAHSTETDDEDNHTAH